MNYTELLTTNREEFDKNEEMVAKCVEKRATLIADLKKTYKKVTLMDEDGNEVDDADAVAAIEAAHEAKRAKIVADIEKCDNWLKKYLG